MSEETEVNGVVENLKILIKDIDQSLARILDELDQGMAMDETRRGEVVAQVIHDIYLLNADILLMFKMNPDVSIETFVMLRGMLIDLLKKVMSKVHRISNRIGAKSCSLGVQMGGAPMLVVRIDL